jgi:hypothetical protein
MKTFVFCADMRCKIVGICLFFGLLSMVLRSKNHKRKEGHHLPLIAEPTSTERILPKQVAKIYWTKNNK